MKVEKYWFNEENPKSFKCILQDSGDREWKGNKSLDFYWWVAKLNAKGYLICEFVHLGNRRWYIKAETPPFVKTKGGMDGIIKYEACDPCYRQGLVL